MTSDRRSALFLAGRDVRHRSAAGGDMQAWTWAVHLRNNGWRVVYIAQSAPGLPAREDVEGVHVHRPGRGLALAVRAWRLHSRRKAVWDLVYEDPIGAGRPPYFSPLYARAPVISVWHQVSAELLRSIHGRVVASPFIVAERLIAVMYRRCSFWAPSTRTADAIARDLGLPRTRIAVIPPTLADHVAIGDRHGGPRAHDFVCVGVIRPYKRFEDAIRAMPGLLEVVPDATLTIAGRVNDPAERLRLDRLIGELGLAGTVQIRTSISDEERQALLSNARALLLPSVLEGFGIVTIEANAEGTPVIASDGVPEDAVVDGGNGLRYAVGDVDALQTLMIRIATDELLWQRLSDRALTHAESLTIPAVAGRFDALVDRALEEA